MNSAGSEGRLPGAVLFPGQGAQLAGMGLDIAEADPAAAAVYARAEEVLGHDLRAVIAGGDSSGLDRTDECQPAILVTSLAVMAALERRDLVDASRVGATAGLSLGEYTALTWAGALELADAVRLVRVRGQAMQAASEERPSGMLSLVGATPAAAASLCDAARGDGVLVVANILAAGQVAVAGTLDAIDRAALLLREHGIRKGVRLAVAGAFHSPCMESAGARLAEALDATPMARPRVPVVMNVSAEPTQEPDRIRDLLKRQLTSPVLWRASMDHLMNGGCTQFLEPAPGKQLSNMVRRTEAACETRTCRDAGELGGFGRWPGVAA